MKSRFSRFMAVSLAALFAFATLAPMLAFATALTEARDTDARTGGRVSLTVASNVIIYAGSLVCVDSTGFANPAADTAGFSVIGRAEQTVDNRTAVYSATKAIEVSRGVFCWANADVIVIADAGKIVYVTDDQTVNKTGGGNNIIAGTVIDVDAAGVWVDTAKVGPSGASAPSSLAVTANGTVGGTFVVTGATALNGGLAMDGTAFTVADTSGNISGTGTMDITGASRLAKIASASQTATTLVCTSALYGKIVLVNTNDAVAITLPANGAPAGSWFEVAIHGAASDACAATISAATADTLIGPNDVDLDSVTWGSGHRIGAQAMFWSDGSFWHVRNLGGTTMTHSD